MGIKQAKACGLDLEVDGVFPNRGIFLPPGRQVRQEIISEDTLLSIARPQAMRRRTLTQPQAFPCCPVSLAGKKTGSSLSYFQMF